MTNKPELTQLQLGYVRLRADERKFKKKLNTGINKNFGLREENNFSLWVDNRLDRLDYKDRCTLKSNYAFMIDTIRILIHTKGI